jgi:polar amino acid transport system substrate-binding protein
VVRLASRSKRRGGPIAACILLSISILGLIVVHPRAEENAAPLRLCVDPDNLPFSSASATTPGFYVELGEQIARTLGRPFQPVWVPTFYTKRQIRIKLLTGQCDGFVGVPDDASFMGPRLIFSRPIVQFGYALIAPAGLAVSNVEDLHGKRVAVQFSSPPQTLLAAENDVQMVTVLSPEEAVRDLADGKADAAFIFGPSAGWLNLSVLHGADRVVPIRGEHTQWGASIAFRHDETDLRDSVDHALAGLGTTINALSVKYGFPAPAVVLPASSDDGGGTPPHQDAATQNGANSGNAAAPPATASGATAAALSAEDVAAGRKLFNTTCAHCHGPDAVQGEQRRNLRMLQQRYGDDFPQMFMNTVTHGRVNKGMPNWSGIISDDEFRKILAFLTSVQEPGS